MKPLPRHDYTPSRAAACWLLGTACLLWPVDLLLLRYGQSRMIKLGTFTYQGIVYEHWEVPLWLEAARVVPPFAAICALALTRRIRLADVGLTIGKPKVTLWWAIVVPAIIGGVILLGIGLIILVVRVTGWSLPVHEIQPISISQKAFLWRGILYWCVLTPLTEESLYRGFLGLSLERLGGRWLALLGCGVVWAVLHFYYGWSAWLIPYYFGFWGVLVTWMFLQSRSLLPTLWLHGLGNLLAPILSDLLLISHPDFIPKLLGYS